MGSFVPVKDLMNEMKRNELTFKARVVHSFHLKVFCSDSHLTWITNTLMI